jgi:hypothetical protein
LRAAAAIEDDGEVAHLEIGDRVAVRVAVEIEADLRVVVEDFLERFAADEVVFGHVVLEKGVVAEKDDRFLFGNQGEDLFEVLFELFRKAPF